MADAALVLGFVSTCTFVGSLLLLPIFLARLPAEHFTRIPCRRSDETGWRPLVRKFIGLSLLVLGAAMLLLPGQGILTLVVACGLFDCPRLRAWERRLVSLPGVLGSMNWLRARLGREPFEPPATAGASSSLLQS